MLQQLAIKKSETINKMKIHPAAEIFPMLSGEELDSLAADIKAHGLRHELVTYEGELLDGRNRWAACKAAGVDPSFVEYKGDSPVSFVISVNIKRRQLDASQRACVAAEIEPMFAVEAKKRYDETVGRPSKQSSANLRSIKAKASEYAAKVVSVSPRMVEYAKEIKAKNPEAFERVKSGEVTVNEVLKEIKKEKRKADIDKQKEDIKTGAIKMPSGVFEVIAMDPPWNYGREYDPDGSRVANPYPEMCQAELLELEPPFAKDCVLFLWSTHAFIWDAKQLLDKWGFSYKATLVWDKEKIGMGSWLRMQCEFCLVAVRGNPAWNNTTWRDIIREPRREHSRKPEAFYKMCEEVTVGRKLEYFSRSKRVGWSSVGNESSKF